MSDQPASMRRVFEIEDDDKPAKRVVCFDPDDPEVIDRVAEAMAYYAWYGWSDKPSESPEQVWAKLIPRVQDRWLREARAVLSVFKEKS